jgi:hypothetical protein
MGYYLAMKEFAKISWGVMTLKTNARKLFKNIHFR